MKKNKLLIICLIIIIMFTASGCWSRREINNLSIARTIAVDKEPDGKTRLTYLFAKPGAFAKMGAGAAPGEKAYFLISATGETLYDTERNISLGLSRKLFMGQNSLIIIGEEAARAGVRPITDFFTRHKDVRLTTWLLVHRGKASDLLKIDPALEKSPALEILGSINFAQRRVSKSISRNTRDFLVDLGNPGIEPVLPEIQLVPLTADEDLKAQKKAGESSQSRFRLAGTAIFNKDRLVGWLSALETKGLHFATSKQQIGIVVIKPEKDPAKKVSIEITEGNSKIKPIFSKGKVSIRIEVKVKGTLGEDIEIKNIENPEMFKKLDQHTEKVIKNLIQLALNQAQKKYKIDFFGFGQAIWRDDPKYWKEIEKDWDKIFPGLPVEIAVDAKVIRSGMFGDYFKED